MKGVVDTRNMYSFVLHLVGQLLIQISDARKHNHKVGLCVHFLSWCQQIGVAPRVTKWLHTQTKLNSKLEMMWEKVTRSIVRQLPKDIAWRNLHFGHRYLSCDLKPKHTVAQSGSTTFKANIHFYGQRTLPLFGKFKQISILAFMAAVVLSLQRCCHVVTQMAASQSQSEGRNTQLLR